MLIKKSLMKKVLISSLVVSGLCCLHWLYTLSPESTIVGLSHNYPLRDDIIATLSPKQAQELIAARKNLMVVDNGNLPDNPFGNLSYLPEVFAKNPFQDDVNDNVQKQLVQQRGDGDSFTAFPVLPGENVITMALYGSQERYTVGAIHNAQLAKRNFPGWKLRIYTETPSANPRFGIVPQSVIYELRRLGADIHYIDPGQDGIPPMMWRFLVGDDEWVDRFIVRDADARLIERDGAAVQDWVRSGRPVHCIRDHPSHASYPISGGLWGAKSKEIRDILRRPWRELMRGKGEQYFDDMNFLIHIIWPRVEHVAYCSDSVSCTTYPNSFPFPVRRYGYEHVGQVYDQHDLGRPIDVRILRQAGENPDCLPRENTNKQHIIRTEVNRTETRHK